MRRRAPCPTFGFWLLAFGLSGAASCARPVFVLPTGAGVPAPEARAAWTSASAACRDVRTLTAELQLSGRAGASGKIKGRAIAGLTAIGQVRLEMPAPFGRAIFILAGSADRATLVTRDNHVLTAPAASILEALTGLSLSPSALVSLLTGCGSREDPAGEPLRHGNLVAFGRLGNRRYLSPGAAGSWKVVAAELPGWLVDYKTGSQSWPDEVRVTSTTTQQPAISLTIRQSQVELNTNIPPAAFTVTVPAGAVPITLEELRASGPLGDRK